jgi:hypothetical protein
MNEWLHTKMKDQVHDPSAAGYLMDNGHFIPQYEFIFGPHEVRMVDYVLRMDDSLPEQFHKLMDAFSLEGVKLEKMTALGAQTRDSETHLEVKDLDGEANKMIHELYSKDIALLGYNR